jgi:hypothetical protein
MYKHAGHPRRPRRYSIPDSGQWMRGPRERRVKLAVHRQVLTTVKRLDEEARRAASGVTSSATTLRKALKEVRRDGQPLASGQAPTSIPASAAPWSGWQEKTGPK